MTVCGSDMLTDVVPGVLSTGNKKSVTVVQQSCKSEELCMHCD